MPIIEKLNKIQCELNAPKSQYNNFGKYAYRNCEDILSAVKELLKATKTAIVLEDSLVEKNGGVYVEATATLYDTETSEQISTHAYAKEEDNKGMSPSQRTGASSSYARKYALNGLFAIDDTKDADTPIEEKKPEAKKEPKLNFYTLPQEAIDKLVNGAKAKNHTLTQEDVDKYINKLAEKEKEKYAGQ